MVIQSNSSSELTQYVVKNRTAKPFLKWAGGKQQLLNQFTSYLPGQIDRYIEPFTGGGALFFHLWNTHRITEQIFLFDNNADLITTYRAVRDHVDAVIEQLTIHQHFHNREYYYHIRGLDRCKDVDLNDIEKAARMIYLNRTCYNGLYRVNRRGEFNVPMGSYVDPQILYEETLYNASAALQGVELKTQDFRDVLETAQAGDFIYFDPPYDPVSKTASFTGYTAGSFGDADQQALAQVFATLTQKGCRCMLSNSYTPFILDLYREFQIKTVLASRAINSNGNARGAIKEVIILNY
ncbi:MAG: DNA adenine methylase [Caldilineaceae bacterium]